MPILLKQYVNSMEGKTKTAEEIWNNTGFIDDYKIMGIKKQLDFAVIQTMETYATQEREKAVEELKKELLNNLPLPYDFDDLYYMERIKEVIEKLK